MHFFSETLVIYFTNIFIIKFWISFNYYLILYKYKKQIKSKDAYRNGNAYNNMRLLCYLDGLLYHVNSSNKLEKKEKMPIK